MKQKCFKCNGKGYIIDIDWFAGVFTFGLSALMDASNKKLCNVCDGKGYIEDK